MGDKTSQCCFTEEAADNAAAMSARPRKVMGDGTRCGGATGDRTYSPKGA
jgi:hypothetical protein